MINKERLIKSFMELVATDNPSYGERAICDFITARLRSLGITPYEDDTASKIGGSAGNLYAYVEGTLDLPPILLSAHMDTVEPSCGKRAVIHDDGRITSDGKTALGADDLSGVAAILEALTVIKSPDFNIKHRPIEVLFDSAEEVYCDGIRNFDFSMLKSKEAYVFDLSESVGYAANEAPAIISFKADFTGRAAHAAFTPDEGIHAIKTAAAAVSQIKCGHVDNTTVNIGTIAGGSADNIIPERCTVTGEVRSFNSADAEMRLCEIEAVFRSAAADFSCKLDFSSKTLCDAYYVDPGHPVAQRFYKACDSIGIKATICRTHGGSDNNHFVRHGINGLVVATGMRGCHSSREYINSDDLALTSELVSSLILSEV
ncbi:MAG: M20/M25/M40 family metallo-hydrolase [Eubacteriales bacterium]|jgi:tripeptide aminopeptidase|nr:M20/M25/M40 family metallo-hydrolase [Clostridiales bacterium]